MSAKPRKPNGVTFTRGRTSKATTGPRKITYWSFSLYNTYKQCPQKAKFNAIDKIKEPGNLAMKRGNDVHKLCEDYIKSDITAKQLTDGAKKLKWDSKGTKPELDRLRKVYANRNRLAAKGLQPAVEDTWAFTSKWDQTVWDDWINCWVRIKLDVGEMFEEDGRIIYVPTDWKTGQIREEKTEEYLEQLELYALAALLVHPHVDEVRPRLVYVDHDLVYPGPDDVIAFRREDEPKLRKLWEKRTKPMLNDTKFAPRVGSYCKWCFYRRSNAANGGGQCKY